MNTGILLKPSNSPCVLIVKAGLELPEDVYMCFSPGYQNNLCSFREEKK